MPKTTKDPYRPRKCRLCKAAFKPTTRNPANAAEQEFCCSNHRKEYWKHGALPFDKMMLRVEKRVREIVREEISDQKYNDMADRFMTLVQTRPELIIQALAVIDPQTHAALSRLAQTKRSVPAIRPGQPLMG